MTFRAEMHRRSFPAFTLAELLIALAILGVIATFTIPKIIVTQQNGKYNAAAKEVAAMISGAYVSAFKDGIINSSTTAGALTQYMNYLAVDTTSSIDGMNGGNVNNCSGTTKCLTLHNGGKLLIWNDYFNGTNTTNVLLFQFDPDGVVTDGTTDGPGKSVKFALYYDGRLTSRNYVLPGTSDSLGNYSPTTTADPSWFQW